MRKIWMFGMLMLFLCSLAYAYPAAMDFEINPCVSYPWGNNTPLSISITPYACNQKTDPWNYCDKVAVKAAIYFANTNIQVDETYWSSWYSSHTEFTFDSSHWNVNKTSGETDANLINFTIRIYAKSNDTLYTANYTDLSFQVINMSYYDNHSLNYVWYGDCVTTGVVGAGGVNVTGGEDVISKSLKSVEEEIGWGTTLLWIMVMIIIAIVMWASTAEFGSAAGMGVVILVEFCLLIVGIYLGFVPAWILYVILLIGVMIAGSQLYKLIGGR